MLCLLCKKAYIVESFGWRYRSWRLSSSFPLGHNYYSLILMDWLKEWIYINYCYVALHCYSSCVYLHTWVCLLLFTDIYDQLFVVSFGFPITSLTFHSGHSHTDPLLYAGNSRGNLFKLDGSRSENEVERVTNHILKSVHAITLTL